MLFGWFGVKPQLTADRHLACHTVHMAFHESFWVAVATAAPVIALANTVSLIDVVNVRLSSKVPHRRPRSWNSWASKVAYFSVIFLSCLNLLNQSLLMTAALQSLLAGSDIRSGGPAITFLSIGLVYVLIIVLTSIVLRYSLREEEKKADQEARKHAKNSTGLGWP